MDFFSMMNGLRSCFPGSSPNGEPPPYGADGFFGGNNFIWIILLAFIFLWGGGGCGCNGFFGGNGLFGRNGFPGGGNFGYPNYNCYDDCYPSRSHSHRHRSRSRSRYYSDPNDCYGPAYGQPGYGGPGFGGAGFGGLGYGGPGYGGYGGYGNYWIIIVLVFIFLLFGRSTNVGTTNTNNVVDCAI